MTDTTKKIQKHPGGRPTVLTPNVVSKLVAALQEGMTDRIACQYAGISHEAFYSGLKRDGEFASTIASAKNLLTLAAGHRVKDIIIKGSDREAGQMARWYLERLLPEQFAPKPEVIVNNNMLYEPPSWFIPTKTIEGETIEKPSQETSQPSEASSQATGQEQATPLQQGAAVQPPQGQLLQHDVAVQETAPI